MQPKWLVLNVAMHKSFATIIDVSPLKSPKNYPRGLCMAPYVKISNFAMKLSIKMLTLFLVRCINTKWMYLKKRVDVAYGPKLVDPSYLTKECWNYSTSFAEHPTFQHNCTVDYILDQKGAYNGYCRFQIIEIIRDS